MNQSAQRYLWTAVPSWLVSMVVHILLLLLLAVFSLPNDVKDTFRQLTLGGGEEQAEEIEDITIDDIDIESEMELTTETLSMEVLDEDFSEPVALSITPEAETPSVDVNLVDFAEKTAPKSDLLATVGAISGNAISGRGSKMRRELLKASGGSKGSEAAVGRALEWLSKHQLPDGGWSFDHRAGKCNGRCPNPGNLSTARNAATAMALLPFLGAGHTHHEGKYKSLVHRGLYFLLAHMKTANKGGLATGSFEERGGSMYSHGLCAIVLCEAYAMTEDKELAPAAQLALNYIIYAQDPVGGGWRYRARMPGDTSVVGWQLMALKSGYMAHLMVPTPTIIGVDKFLNSVQSPYGGAYGYTRPAAAGKGGATTAVGLLCRMYLGWKRDHPGIERGVEILDKAGPSKGNMYYNYYATQVMRHAEGPEWERWNKRVRDPLIEAQSRKGHSDGSWMMRGDHGSDRGGRLYCTSMATMILEVYYRHMPIYKKEAAEDDFPL